MRRGLAAALDRAPQGAHRRAARPAHAAHGAAVRRCCIGPAGAARDLGAGGHARVARRAARGLRRRPRARADAAQLPRAPDLHRQGGAGRLRSAAARARSFSDPVRGRARRLRGRAGARRRRRWSRSSPTAPNQRSEAAPARIERLLGGFGRERALLAWRCAASRAQLLEPMQHRRARPRQPRRRAATRITGMLPFFVMMAVLYGALNAALDTTAGERERGSLEPLLMNPAERWALVVGKWGAVACVGMLIAVLQLLQLPARPVAAAQRNAGGAVPVRAARGAAVPGACCCRSPRRCRRVLMAVAIRCKTFKEAQASATIVILAVSLLPLVNAVQPGRRGALAPVGAGAGAEHADDARAQGRGLRPGRGAASRSACASLLTAVGVWYVAAHAAPGGAEVTGSPHGRQSDLALVAASTSSACASCSTSTRRASGCSRSSSSASTSMPTAATRAAWHLAAWSPTAARAARLRARARSRREVRGGVDRPRHHRRRRPRPRPRPRAGGAGDRRTPAGLAGRAIRISAQTRLERFYADFGFVAVGAPYLEDGIEHTEMLRPGAA